MRPDAEWNCCICFSVSYRGWRAGGSKCGSSAPPPRKASARSHRIYKAAAITDQRVCHRLNPPSPAHLTWRAADLSPHCSSSHRRTSPLTLFCCAPSGPLAVQLETQLPPVLETCLTRTAPRVPAKAQSHQHAFHDHHRFSARTARKSIAIAAILLRRTSQYRAVPFVPGAKVAPFVPTTCSHVCPAWSSTPGTSEQQNPSHDNRRLRSSLFNLLERSLPTALHCCHAVQRAPRFLTQLLPILLALQRAGLPHASHHPREGRPSPVLPQSLRSERQRLLPDTGIERFPNRRHQELRRAPRPHERRPFRR